MELDFSSSRFEWGGAGLQIRTRFAQRWVATPAAVASLGRLGQVVSAEVQVEAEIVTWSEDATSHVAVVDMLEHPRWILGSCHIGLGEISTP